MKYLLTSIALVLGLMASAQNVEFKSANFKDDKEGFKKAVEAIKAGDEFFELGNNAIFAVQSPGLNFELAKREYEKAQKFNSKNAELNYKIGVCHANSAYSEKCIPFLKKAFELDPACNPFLDYYYGYALQLDGDFTAAKKSYEKFAASYKKADDFTKFVSKRKKECKAAIAATASPVRAWVDNVSELNTPQNEYGPSVSTDGAELIMTSNRPNGHTPNEIGVYDDDIYVSSIQDGKWSKPKAIKGPVNSEADDVSNNLSYDGTKLLMHRVEDGQCDIFESKLVGADWTAPTKLQPAISSKRANERFASYSPDGWSIYFNRDNANRSTGYEVMYSSMQSKLRKDFMAAQMISTINSKFNEGPIYVHLDGETMYIASEGDGSLGGYDIFVSKNINGTWSKPKNMGYPINTQYDHFFFSATANGKYAYIASNRSGGSGGYDIYKVTFWGPEKEPVMATEDYLLASIINPIADNSIEES
ncbi:MAG: hypothetical protein AB8B56_05695, partial [Crocinitomicaceae bacterium]